MRIDVCCPAFKGVELKGGARIEMSRDGLFLRIDIRCSNPCFCAKAVDEVH